MWLGSLASTGSFRSEIDVPRGTLVRMLVASTGGSIAGAIILLRTPNSTFAGLIPFLLLAATAIFIAGPALTRASQHAEVTLTPDSPAGLVAQTCIAVYGGFFGAAAGILTTINGVAVVPFVLAKVIAWEPAAFMSTGAIAGGFLGAHLVKRLSSETVRAFVIVVACTMTLYFFWLDYIRR
jgi:uncharacterized membrane protein YfcA